MKKSILFMANSKTNQMILMRPSKDIDVLLEDFLLSLSADNSVFYFYQNKTPPKEYIKIFKTV